MDWLAHRKGHSFDDVRNPGTWKTLRGLIEQAGLPWEIPT